LRKVLYSVAASLDGYIAGPSGEYDWIPMDPEAEWADFIGRFDVVLMGRHTDEATTGAGSGSSLPNLPTYVFSRALKQADHEKVPVVSGEPAQFIGELRGASG